MQNNIDKTLLFFDMNDEYLGLQVNPNSSISNFKILEDIVYFQIKNLEDDMWKQFDYSENIIINSF